MGFLKISMLVFAACFSVVLAMPRMGKQDMPNAMNAECMREGCNETCYIPHPSSCFKFIVCKPISGGGYLSQLMPCAFGTMWKEGPDHSCDLPELAGCKQDPCKNPKMISYPHDGNNCRTYWKCENKQSVPACCSLYQKFVANGNNGTCVNDTTCDMPCSLLNDDETPSNSVSHRDPNCLTLDICNDPNITSYQREVDACGTYRTCENSRSVSACCKPAQRFVAIDNNNGTCVDDMTCNSMCPVLKADCPFEAVPNNPSKYKNLDSHGGHEMPCAVGTIFDQLSCQCKLDKALQNKAKAAAAAGVCKIAIDVRFPNLKNTGAAAAAILMIGDYGQGEKGVGNMMATWDGQDGVNIPYYGNQELPSFYLEIAFTPTNRSAGPQVLLSSCRYDTLGVPSLEVRLVPASNNGGNLSLSVSNRDSSSMLQAGVPYQLNVPYIFRMIYDGKAIGVYLETADGSSAPVKDVRGFSGVVPIHRAGLRFAHCRYNDRAVSFIGTVSTIKFSKCVTDMMKLELVQGQVA